MVTVKDHKRPDANGDYPTQFVIPASNFVSPFANLGYRGIKAIFDSNKVSYQSKMILNAYDLKCKLEKLKVSVRRHMVVSLDIKDFYPSVRFSLIAKAVWFFGRGLSIEDRSRLNVCLKLIQFGMSHTLLMFKNAYYEHRGHGVPSDRGLTIGGLESAWLADLAGAYVLQSVPRHFRGTIYHGLYRDGSSHFSPYMENHRKNIKYDGGLESTLLTISFHY